MSEHVVKITMRANIAEYKKGMLEAAQATRTVGSESEKLAQARQSFEQVGRAGVAMGALLTAGIGIAVKRFADFDEAMSNVAAATHESAENMGLLRVAALDAGHRRCSPRRRRRRRSRSSLRRAYRPLTSSPAG